MTKTSFTRFVALSTRWIEPLHDLKCFFFFLLSSVLQSVLLPSNLGDEEEDGSVLPESISISRIDDLLAQMRIHEVPKRAQFSLPFELAEGFVLGIKG